MDDDIENAMRSTTKRFVAVVAIMCLAGAWLLFAAWALLTPHDWVPAEVQVNAWPPEFDDRASVLAALAAVAVALKVVWNRGVAAGPSNEPSPLALGQALARRQRAEMLAMLLGVTATTAAGAAALSGHQSFVPGALELTVGLLVAAFAADFVIDLGDDLKAIRLRIDAARSGRDGKRCREAADRWWPDPDQSDPAQGRDLAVPVLILLGLALVDGILLQTGGPWESPGGVAGRALAAAGLLSVCMAVSGYFRYVLARRDRASLPFAVVTAGLALSMLGLALWVAWFRNPVAAIALLLSAAMSFPFPTNPNHAPNHIRWLRNKWRRSVRWLPGSIASRLIARSLHLAGLKLAAKAGSDSPAQHPLTRG